jgi:hypothetical protein
MTRSLPRERRTPLQRGLCTAEISPSRDRAAGSIAARFADIGAQPVRFTAFLLVLICLSPPIRAQSLSEDFDPTGIDESLWKRWPEADERLFTSNAHNHTSGGTYAAMAVEADPYGYASYADFGEISGEIYAEAWVYDMLDDAGTDLDRPVSCMLALISGTPAVDTFDYTDYLQLGVVAYHTSGLSTTYSIRTAYRDAHGGSYLNTGVPRKLGWTKLGIHARSLADGGQVTFFIDDVPVGISRRSGTLLRYVRLGLPFKSYDYFWYDDVTVGASGPPDGVRFDTDLDGDVDMTDFSVLQRCYTGLSGVGLVYHAPTCWAMDADENGHVDAGDFVAFQNCATRSSVPADPACDDLP